MGESAPAARPGFASPPPVTQGWLQPFIIQWNARNWDNAATALKALVAQADAAGQAQLKRVLVHLRGIALCFAGRYDVARGVFEESVGRGWEEMGEAELAALSWLGTTCVLLRRWDDAALAYAMRASPVTMPNITTEDSKESSPPPTSPAVQQALSYITSYNAGLYTNKPNHIKLLTDAMTQNPDKHYTRILRHIPASTKVSFLSAAASMKDTSPAQDDPPDYTTELSSTLTLSGHDLMVSTQSYNNPWAATTGVAILTYDATILLNPRKYNSIADAGLQIAEHALTYSFLGKHQFPQTNMMALHTVKRPLRWVVQKLKHGFAVKGFVSREYGDRLRFIRCREWGPGTKGITEDKVKKEGKGMDYVAGFVVVMHKWPLVEKFGVTVPIASVKEEWTTNKTAGTWVHNKLSAEVKDLLVEADAVDEPGATGDETAQAQEEEAETDDVAELPVSTLHVDTTKANGVNGESEPSPRQRISIEVFSRQRASLDVESLASGNSKKGLLGRWGSIRAGTGKSRPASLQAQDMVSSTGGIGSVVVPVGGKAGV